MEEAKTDEVCPQERPVQSHIADGRLSAPGSITSGDQCVKLL